MPAISGTSVDAAAENCSVCAVAGRLEHVPGHRVGCRDFSLPVPRQFIAGGDVKAHLLARDVRQLVSDIE